VSGVKNIKMEYRRLKPLYHSFMEWKQGTFPYFEQTERIHLFHKKNQEIYKEFE
jgi:hypothetical protein